jgi:hypothetical protein
MTQPWNAAKTASRRALPKPRKMHGAVGTPIAELIAPLKAEHPRKLTPLEWSRARLDYVRGDTNAWLDCACQSCGYHVCSCKPSAPFVFPLGGEIKATPTAIELNTVVGPIKVVADPNHHGPPVFKETDPLGRNMRFPEPTK